MDPEPHVAVPRGVTPADLAKALEVRLPQIYVLLMEHNILKTVREPLNDEEIKMIAKALHRDVRIG